MSKSNLLPFGAGGAAVVGGGGGGGAVDVTKSTHKTVQVGALAEMDPWVAGSGAPIITMAHGLARQPDFYETYIECVVATSTDGYSMGDRVPNVHTPWRITVRSDDTNTYLISSNSGSRFGISDLDSGRSSDDFTASQWKFVAAPYIFVDTEVVTGVTGGGAELSDADPVVEGVAASGVSDEASRADHVHPDGGGGGGGQSQAQVDARVTAGVLDWAEAANTDPIPADKLTNAPSGGGDGTDDQIAAEVPYTSTAGGIIPSTATNVQTALDAVDGYIVPTGTDDQDANEVPASVTNFGTNIPVAADTVQKALDALDDLEVGGGDSTPVTGSADSVATTMARMSREVVLASGEIANTAAATEFTLIKDIAPGEILVVLLTERAAAYAQFFTDELLAQETEHSAAPNRNSAENGFVVKIHQAGTQQFGHDDLYVFKSDEANKLWLVLGRSAHSSGTVQDITIIRHYVDVSVAVETALTLAGGGGGGGGGGSYLPSLDDTPAGVADDGLWNRRGLFVQEHTKQLADSTRAYTSFDLSTAFVNVDGALIGNVNRPGNWLGLFLEDEHAAGGVRRPAAASNNDQFGLNAANGHFEKSNGTDWLEYDPFASGQPWENAYPYGAYSDRTYTTGVKDGRGFRVSMTGKLGVQIGENGNEWETRITADATITDASKVVISAESTPLTKVLTITVKTMDGGDDTPTIVAVVGALNSFQPGGTLAGFLVTASYIGYVLFTDKLDSSDAGGTFAPGSIDFANGGAGTEGVPLTHLDYWAETLTELNESWSAVGQVGLDFSGGDLHAVTAYTAPEAGGIEETIKTYRPPGFRQVVSLGKDDIRPAPSRATIGQLFINYSLKTATFDSEKPVAATQAEGTSVEYTNALFNGIQTTGHRVYSAGHVYYNSVAYSWHLSILDQVIFSGYVWATVDFDNLGTNAGLPLNKHWLGDWASANLAAQAIQGYSSATRYYFRNTTTDKIEYLSAVTPSIGQHIDFETVALGVVKPYYGNPTAYFWGRGQTERNPSTYPNANILGGIIHRMRFAASGPHEHFNGGSNDFSDIFVAVADVSSNIDSGVNLDANTVITLNPGRYNFEIFSALDPGASEHDSHLSLRKVDPGPDDIVVVDTLSFRNEIMSDSSENIYYIAHGLEKDVVVDGTEQFYMAWAGLGSGTSTRHYFRAERVG